MTPDGLCPDCKNVLNAGAKACSCGWREVKKRRASREDDAIDRNCTWDDHGYRCGVPGSLSEITNGAGPWYCRDHWAKLKGWPEVGEGKRETYRARWYREHPEAGRYQPPERGNLNRNMSLREPGEDAEEREAELTT